MFRLINDETKNNFSTMLETYDWNTVESENTNTFSDTFIITVINDLYCKCSPRKIKYISNKQVNNPWITSDLRKLILYKSQYFRLLKIKLTETK